MRLLFAAIVLATSTIASNASGPAAPPPGTCDKPENRQFDFWIGHWQAFETKDHSPQGESLIEPLYEGCTIRENWVDPQLKGGSLNTYVAADGKWHQLWTDSSGAWREFIGGLVNGEMVLISNFPSIKKPGAMAHSKMTFTPNADGSVRQHQVRWVDGGPVFEAYDYTYRKVAK